jgi:LPS export ABC transporter protein LptC
MQELRRKKPTVIDLRARVPRVTRVLALIALIACIVVAAISYYRLRNNGPFILKGKQPELSKEVQSIVEGYERRMTEGDRLVLLVRAARDVTYTDGHHELEQVHLESYPANSPKPNVINAERALYDQKNNQITFTGNVRIQTHDDLIAQSETMVYNHTSEMAETSVPVTFSRENISGHATGVKLDVKSKKLEMLSDVEITVSPEAKKDNPAAPNLRGRPVTIRAGHAIFDQPALHLSFTGGATAEQERDVMSGDSLSATLNAQKRVQKIEARGNSYLRSMNEGKAAEAHSADMDFFFDTDQQLQRAVAMRDVRVRSLDADSEMQLNGANTVDVYFQRQGDRSVLKEMHVDGRSICTLSAPQSRLNDPRAANKRLTADAMKLYWRTSGRDLERAEAVGNAELVVDPVQKTGTADRKTLTAARFDCDFYESGNLTRTFTATDNAKAVIEAVVPSQERATRTIESQKMVANFVRETQDVERIDAQGDAKFNELDRNGRAANSIYTASDETIRLRGGEPTVWDARARLKAQEIDSDRRNDISYARGHIATTYYSQEQTNGATPFSKVKSPVFVVSDRAEFRHATGVAIYTNNARAWQDDNFVRGDKITIYRDNKRMEADGHVQSALYNTKRKNPNGTTNIVPVFASSDHMWYSDTDRLLHYESNVDIRQDTDRITSNVADVYLARETNEVEKTVAQNNVVLTQPGRTGRGDWAQYTAADDTVVLKGAPAHVEDTEQGTTESTRLTVYLRDSRVVADDARGENAPGRARSTHRIRKQ